jgi:hypothetical protein
MCEEGGGVQKLKWIEDKRCTEWEECRSTRGRRIEKCNGCMQLDNEEDKEPKSCRTVMRLVSCC